MGYSNAGQTILATPDLAAFIDSDTGQLTLRGRQIMALHFTAMTDIDKALLKKLVLHISKAYPDSPYKMARYCGMSAYRMKKMLEWAKEDAPEGEIEYGDQDDAIYAGALGLKDDLWDTLAKAVAKVKANVSMMDHKEALVCADKITRILTSVTALAAERPGNDDQHLTEEQLNDKIAQAMKLLKETGAA